MTKYNVFRKSLVLGILILFIGASVLPNFNSYVSASNGGPIVRDKIIAFADFNLDLCYTDIYGHVVNLGVKVYNKGTTVGAVVDFDDDGDLDIFYVDSDPIPDPDNPPLDGHPGEFLSGVTQYNVVKQAELDAALNKNIYTP